MRTRLRATLGAALLALALPALSARAQLPVSSEDLAVIGAYRLTMPAMVKFATVNRVLAEEVQKDPRMVERMALSTELEALEGKEKLTAAEEERAKVVRDRIRVLVKELRMGGGRSLKDMEAAMQAYPPMVAALRAGGIEAREFAILMMASMQSGMAAAMADSPGFDKSKLTEVQLANIKFINENEAELKRLRQPASR